jgi:hypothetical protein
MVTLAMVAIASRAQGEAGTGTGTGTNTNTNGATDADADADAATDCGSSCALPNSWHAFETRWHNTSAASRTPRRASAPSGPTTA